MYGASSGEGAQSSSIQSDFGQVAIENIPDRDGQYLRNALIDRFYQNGRPAQPKYKLTVQTIRETTTDLDITKSSDATRGQLKLNTAMALVDVATGRRF